MCTTKFNLYTYNTHLFGGFNPTNIALLGSFKDKDRKDAIDQTYLQIIAPYSKSGAFQIAALQEVWDASYADDIARDVDSSHHGSFNERFYLETMEDRVE